MILIFLFDCIELIFLAENELILAKSDLWSVSQMHLYKSGLNNKFKVKSQL